jgi:hypothetical protein
VAVTDALPIFEAMVPVMLLGVAIWRLPYALQDRQHRPLWMIFTLLGALTAISEPAISRFIDRTSGIHDLSVHFALVTGMIMTTAVIDYVHSVTTPRTDIRWWFRAGVAAAAITMTVLFTLVPRHVETGGTDAFLLWYEGQGVATAYLMLFATTMGSAAVLGSRMFWRAGRAADSSGAPRHLRVGLYLSALALSTTPVFVLLYMLIEITHVVDVNLALDGTLLIVIRILQVVSAMLFAIGTCMLRAALFARAVRDFRSLRELEPLWQLLRVAVPYITLDTGVPVHGNSLRLHRRVIEIRDGIVALRDYVTADVVAAARATADRVPLGERAATVEALEIVGAIGARDSGLPPTATSFESPFDGASFDSEVTWLRQVSRALRSRVVHEAMVDDAYAHLDHQNV